MGKPLQIFCRLSSATPGPGVATIIGNSALEVPSQQLDSEQ